MQWLLTCVLRTGTPKDVRVEGMGLKSLPPGKLPPDSARGQIVYQQICASCHGANGQGQLKTPPNVGYSIPPLWGRTRSIPLPE